MFEFIYWTKNGKFETDDLDEIPWGALHSPDDNTPALIYPSGIKEWYFEGERHRLSGPAKIWYDGDKWFYLNDICYEFKEWIYNHPNFDLYLEVNGYITNAEKTLWKLKNL